MNRVTIKKLKEFNIPTLKESQISFLKDRLHVSFSSDFYETSRSGDFTYFTTYHIYNFFLENAHSIIGETLRFRHNCNLPLDTLILSEDDASILLMRCCGTHEEVYWIAVEDFYNYCEGKPLEHNPTIFKSFPEFFEYLLNEEEKSRSIPA